MKGAEAFQELIPLFKDAPVVHANGFICRESFSLQDRKANFYMIGSMGLASSIGLGVALCKPDRKVIILDGDGNVLMAMGTLAMIAAEAPKNLVHVVIDNEVYESTGKQRSISNAIALEKVAESSGYRQALRVEKKEEIKPAFEKLMNSEGPSFLLIKVEPCFDPKTGRVTHTPEEITQRFAQSLSNK
jgi:sulfopyruvate decarboxylase subunit beta